MNRNRPTVDANILLDRLVSLTEAEFSVLQNAFYWRWLEMLLRNNGWINLILGGFTLWLGLSGLHWGLLKGIQALLGASILGVSIWSLAMPSRQTIFGFSVIFVIAGAWNLFLGIRDGAFGAGLLLILFGLLQLRWGYQFYQIYSQQIPVGTHKPNKATKALYETVWQEFALTRYAHSEQLLEVIFGRERWRGFIFRDYVAFASPKRKYVIFARKAEFEFAAKNPDGGQKDIKGNFRVNALINKAKMQRDFFDRYLQWKASA